MATDVLLLEIEPRNLTTGARETVRLAGMGYQFPYLYAGEQWLGGLETLPTIICEMLYSPGEFGNGAVPQAAQLAWRAQSEAQLVQVANYHWKGAPFTLYLGAENATGTLPDVLMTGNAMAATVQGGSLNIALADPAADLQKPVLVNTFQGTGGTEGPTEWLGRPKRRIWGRVYNVEGYAIDTANNIYSFSDPGFRLNDFLDVRDKGVETTSLTILAWQGTVAGTFAALQAASAPAGGGVACPSIGMVKWWTEPAGILTADIQGESFGGAFVANPATVAEAIVQARGGPVMAAGTVTAALTARPEIIGIVVADMNTTVASVLDQVLGGSSLYWVLDAETGEIRLGVWEFGASLGSFTSEDVQRVDAFPPVKARRLGYRKNHRQMAAGDLAAILTYGDGTPIDDLQPAAAGADVTAANTAAAIAGQGSLATQNSVDPFTQVDALADAMGWKLTGTAAANPTYLSRAPGTVKKTGGSSGWHASALSINRYVRGAVVGCALPDTFNSSNWQVFVGLLEGNDLAASGAENNAVTYSMEVNGAADRIYCKLNGNSQYQHNVAPAPGDSCQVRYRGTTVEFVHKDVVIYSMAAAAGLSLRGAVGVYDVGASVRSLFFGAYADGVKVDSVETGADVTGNNTAAAIVGQGTGATANSLAQLNTTDDLWLYSLNADSSNLTLDYSSNAEFSAQYSQVSSVFGSAGTMVSWSLNTGYVSSPGVNATIAPFYPIPIAPDDIVEVIAVLDPITFCDIRLGFYGWDQNKASTNVNTQTNTIAVYDNGGWQVQRILIGGPAVDASLVDLKANATTVWIRPHLRVNVSTGTENTPVRSMVAKKLDVAAKAKLAGIEDGADVTAANVAAAITGQGSLATANAIDPFSQITDAEWYSPWKRIGTSASSNRLFLTGNSIQKYNLNAWDGSAVTYAKYSRGCFVMGTIGKGWTAAPRSMAMGLTDLDVLASGSNEYTEIDFAILVSAGLSRFEFYASGSMVSSLAQVPKDDDTMIVRYRNGTVEFMVNDVVRYTHYTTSGLSLRGMVCLGGIGAQLNNLLVGAYADGEKLDGVEPAADVTSAVTGAATMTVNYDWQDNAVSSLPVTTPYKMTRNGVDVTNSTSWSLKDAVGTFTAAIGSNGVVSLNENGGTITSGRFTIVGVYGGKTREFIVNINKVTSPPPAGTNATGGTSDSSSISGSLSSTSMTAMSGEVEVTVGSNGQVDLSAWYSFDSTGTGLSYAAYARWYWWNGSSWVAIGSEVQSTSNYIPANGEPGEGSINYTHTGRTNGATERYKLYMRNGTGGVSYGYSGTAAAEGK